jgi:uncharacterized protein (TIGR02001 family)
MNKTIASISAAVVVGGSSLSAFVPAAADLGVTSDLTFASEYVFRGVELADNSIQPSIEASLGDFYAGVFANLPIENRDQSLTELHYYGGFALAIPGMEHIVLDLGVTVYHWPDAGQNRSHEGFVGTKFENVGIPGLSAAAYFFYDVDRRTHIVEGSVGYSFALDMVGMTSLDLSALYGNQFGGSIRDNRPGRVGENYHYYGASAELPFRLNEFSTITAGAHYQSAERYDRDLAGRNQNFFWTVSYTAGF